MPRRLQASLTRMPIWPDQSPIRQRLPRRCVPTPCRDSLPCRGTLYAVAPVFRRKELNGEYVSRLNPFFTIWCVIEDILLAATSEGLACSMRIPPNEERGRVKIKLKVPAAYMIPAFIGMGYADPKGPEVEQDIANLEEQVHSGRWKWSAPDRFRFHEESEMYALAVMIDTIYDTIYNEDGS